MNWEGRGGTFAAALQVPEVRTDLYVLGAIADEMDVHLGLPDAAAARAELAVARHLARRPPGRPPAVLSAARPGARRVPARAGRCWPPGTSCWTAGGMQDGEPYLAGTARPVVAGCPRRPRPRPAWPTATR